MTLVALAAAVAALVQAIIAIVVRTRAVQPHWAPAAAAGALAAAAVISLGLGRLRFGPTVGVRLRILRWATLVVAVAAGGIAIGAGLTAG